MYHSPVWLFRLKYVITQFVMWITHSKRKRYILKILLTFIPRNEYFYFLNQMQSGEEWWESGVGIKVQGLLWGETLRWILQFVFLLTPAATETLETAQLSPALSTSATVSVIWSCLWSWLSCCLNESDILNYNSRHFWNHLNIEGYFKSFLYKCN